MTYPYLVSGHGKMSKISLITLTKLLKFDKLHFWKGFCQGISNDMWFDWFLRGLNFPIVFGKDITITSFPITGYPKVGLPISLQMFNAVVCLVKVL